MIIYCNNCIHLSPSLLSFSIKVCYDENNLIRTKRRSWLSEYDDLSFKRTPAEINKNNNCKWHEANG